ncbi:hypothetical protein NDU88_004960 [Pleurodeles waltl]|uniref:Uncharacterized protein n=1 Tax=Pleurodeles waltl TaxID=8319 RepID=A0AAV7N4I1_PLEWA|nr:hypothetical protein NDU88_004960 [Pleurodeles waltl]
MLVLGRQLTDNSSLGRGQDGRRVGVFHWTSAAGPRSEPDRTPKHAIRGRSGAVYVPWRPLSLAWVGRHSVGSCGDRRCGPRRATAGAAGKWRPHRDQGSIAARRRWMLRAGVRAPPKKTVSSDAPE